MHNFQKQIFFKTLIFTLILILAILPLSISGEPSVKKEETSEKKFLVTTLNFGLRIDSVDRAVGSLTSFAEKNGGYLVTLSGSQVVFRIPVTTGEDRIGKEILTIPGINLYSSSREASDVTAQLVDLKTKLRVSRENLTKLRGLSESAGLNDLLDLEKAMSDSLMEVEQMIGEIQYLEESSRLYTVRININGSSIYSDPRLVPIPWIRGLNLQSILGGNL